MSFITLETVCVAIYRLSFYLLQEIESRVTFSLLILQNCAAEAERHFIFHTSADTMLKYLVPYTKLSNPSLSFHAKIVLLLVGPFLRKSDMKHLLFSHEQIKEVMSSLRAALNDGQSVLSLYGATCSMNEVMLWLEKAALAEENIDLMMDYGMLELFPALMRTHDMELATKVAKLMWTVASLDRVKVALCHCSDIVSCLKASQVNITKYTNICIHLSNAGMYNNHALTIIICMPN